MSHAYFVGQITVKDEDKWAQYRNQVPDTLAPWRAELMFRGKQPHAQVNASPHPHIVVIRSPSLADAEAWHRSSAYQALIPLRQEAADVVGTLYEA
jgi:uncharacterized protein (DUF1330 family)